MKKVDRKYHVFVNYDTNSSGGEPEDPSDRYSSRSDHHIEFDMKYISSENEGNIYTEQIAVDFDPKLNKNVELYVVVVRYSSGDTFGSSYGHYHFIGEYTDKIVADTVAESIVKGYKQDDYSDYKKLAVTVAESIVKGYKQDDYSDYKKLAVDDENEYVYMPWVGYFERLESVVVYHGKIDEKRINKYTISQ